MSISPTDDHRSQPLSAAGPLKNPSPDHGLGGDRFRPARGSPGPRQIEKRESIEDGPAEGRGGETGEVEGSTGVTTICPSDLPENVAVQRSSEAVEGLCNQSIDAISLACSVQASISSQIGPDRLGSQVNRLSSRVKNSTQSDLLTSSSSALQSNAAQTASKKNQVGNANYLLNFSYDPISRPPPRARAPPPRRQRKMKPYNKDLFLQANYKFVVLDTGNYQVESMDPDKMLQWEDIICVRYATPFPVQCPICLDTPLCPQITSCGHIYCFPCILRYLLMGKEDHKGDSWKKCPLCFMMISSKDLYNIQIEKVKQIHVGDCVQFTLLSRPKDSLIPSLKNQQEEDTMHDGSDDRHDSFSKFILTSDPESFTREGKSELMNWLMKAESGLVDDLGILPCVCNALEQLEERIKNWTEQMPLSGSPPLRNSVTAHSNKAINVTNKARSNISILSSTSHRSSSSAFESGGGTSDSDIKQEISDGAERDSYTFYQAVDGQHLILHPLNMKCLLHHYGSYDMLPPRISGDILEMEMLTQSEAIRKRYRYLSHFSLTTTIQLCEIDLGGLLPPSSLALFKDEIKKREKQRKQLARKERNEKARAEAADWHAVPILYDQYYLPHKDPSFSSEDFETLGSGVVPSTSPPINGERKRFADVTRLGYAAAHDSPSLRAEGPTEVSGNIAKESDTSGSQGARRMTTLSFASVTSAVKATEAPALQNTPGKKGKKPAKVLLSTAGGRRY